KGVKIDDIPMPDNALIVAVVTEDKVQVADKDITVYPGDTVVVIADSSISEDVHDAFRGL
ncbi:MAG: TrkA family potassium uptake protein, partial [Eggerthellaceae bacterium]|nr:TrkA family potassium uptake protein [Eggerthellaceae bacterium]